MSRLLGVLLGVLLGSWGAWAAPLGEGASLAAVTFVAPSNPADAATLGLKAGTSFTVKDLNKDLIVVEVIGIYCPQCHKQAPGYNSLFTRLGRGKTKDRVAMFAVAAGGTDMEVAQARESMYRFPVVSDPEYRIHKAVGEPLTPYTMVCRRDGTIVFAHLGVIEDVDGLYGRIRDLLP